MRRPLVAAVIALAALLRFAGIGHHLRYGGPEFDERHNFVDPVLRMWDSRSADPTVYNGYPGFFNYVAFVPVGLGRRLAGDRGATLAARGLVAGFGTLSVALAYGLGRRLHGGTWAALAGAALLAVSRLEVRSAHYVTADVLVGTATLAALLALAAWPGRKGELAAAAATALGTAVKYTGLILAPALFVHFWLERRLKTGLVPGLLVAALVFVVAAPFALLGLGSTGAGLVSGLNGYFGAQHGHVAGSGLPELIGTLWLSVGPVGLALAVLSAALPERRRL
ncbi:MAG TPA: glycosyltransferase family 39 protein, partial [Vicinamibacteria bacterium]